MSEEHPVDRIDRKILNALQRDGRMTNRRLADEVGLSSSACLARVKRLESSGVITGYRAQVDRTQLSSSMVVFAQIAVATHDQTTFRRLRETLNDMPEAIEAYQISGDYDFLVRFLVSDINEWAELSAKLTNGGINVVTIKTMVSIRVLKGWAGVPIEPTT